MLNNFNAMPLSISNVSIWEQIYNGVTKRSLIAKKLKHLVSIYPECCTSLLAIKWRGLSFWQPPLSLYRLIPLFTIKGKRKTFQLSLLSIPISISTIYWPLFIPLFPLSQIRCILHRLLARSFHARKG